MKEVKKNKIILLTRGLLKKCPLCGNSPIFRKYIKTFEKCNSCGLRFSLYRSDDGPAYFTIFIVGHLLITMILLIEKNYSPPLILQLSIWPFLTILMCLWLLPRIKGAFIAIQIFLNDKTRKS